MYIYNKLLKVLYWFFGTEAAARRVPKSKQKRIS